MTDTPNELHFEGGHLVAVSYIHPCQVREKRAGMSDEEFWDDVFPQSEYEPEGPDMDCTGIDSLNPCPECGSVVACGYDSEGRPMIHVVQEDDDGV